MNRGLHQLSYTRRISKEDFGELSIDYLFCGGVRGEDRSVAMEDMAILAGVITVLKIIQISDAVCEIGNVQRTLNLFEVSEIEGLLLSLKGKIAIDLNSLEHRVWAPLVSNLVRLNLDFVALYAEPAEYKRSNELPGSVYDLSSSRGIEPLPGFSRLSRRFDDEGYFVPLLGFEGARLSHIFDQEDVNYEKTYPIVGSPGFRLEYPAFTYIANRATLEIDRMDRRAEYATASCPFEAYWALERIHNRVHHKHLRVAPIGTKPHALGAVLYAVLNPLRTELIYDHPVHMPGRTIGSRGLYVYSVSDFVRGNSTS